VMMQAVSGMARVAWRQRRRLYAAALAQDPRERFQVGCQHPFLTVLAPYLETFARVLRARRGAAAPALAPHDAGHA